MLTRLDRYLLREVTVTFIAVTGVLLIILLSNQLARVLGQAVQSGFPGSVVLALIGLTTLQQLTVLVPIGLYLGIVLALGRLYHESEMTAMAACGVGTARIFRPVALLTVLVVGALAVLSYRVVPAAGVRAQEIRVEALRSAQFGSLEAGRFRSFAGGDVVFYAERVRPNGQLEGVFVQRRVGDRVEIAVAERAEQRGAGQAEQLFVLHDGRRYEGIPGALEWRVVTFKEHGIPVRLPEVKAKAEKLSVKPTSALIGSSDAADRSELALAHRGADHGVRADAARRAPVQAAAATGQVRAGRHRGAGLLRLLEPGRRGASVDREGQPGRRVRHVVGPPGAGRGGGDTRLARRAARAVVAPGAEDGRLTCRSLHATS